MYGSVLCLWKTGLVYLNAIWMKQQLNFSLSACTSNQWNEKKAGQSIGEQRPRERRRRKWGQIQKGTFSEWHVSWWKDHFSPFLAIVFSSLPLSLLLLLLSLLTVMWCLPWHCWDGKSKQELSGSPSQIRSQFTFAVPYCVSTVKKHNDVKFIPIKV